MPITRRDLIRATGGLAVAAACGPAATAVSSAAPAATSAGTAAPTAAATPAPKPIAVKGAWVALTSNQMVWPVAKDAGYFAKYGIDLDLSYISGSNVAIAALLAGDIGVTTVAGSAVVSAQAAATDIVMVAGFVNTSIFRVMVTPAITSMAQLKGATIAVTRIGNADYFAWQTIAAKQGWKIDDLKFVNANDLPGQVALLKTGNVQGIAVSPPNNILALQAGGHEILDMATLNEPEQQVGIATSRKYLTENRAAVLGVVKASIEAIARWKKDQAFVKNVIATYLKTTDKDFIDVGYSAYVNLFPQAPYPSEPGLARVIEQVASGTPKAKDLKPAQMIDRSFVQELETSGFIKQVYG